MKILGDLFLDLCDPNCSVLTKDILFIAFECGLLCFFESLAGCCQHVARTVTRAGGHKSSDGAAVGTTEGRGSGWLCKIISLKGKCVCVRL